MLALLVTLGAVLGSLTWPHFLDNERAPSLWFSSLFAATCGMLVGAFIAFPLGGVFGALAGLVSGATCALAWRWAASSSLVNSFASRALVTLALGATTGALMTLWMTR